VTGSVALLRSKPGGGAAWLRELRDVPYAEAVEALCTLPGIGPKVFLHRKSVLQACWLSAIGAADIWHLPA